VLQIEAASQPHTVAYPTHPKPTRIFLQQAAQGRLIGMVVGIHCSISFSWPRAVVNPSKQVVWQSEAFDVFTRAEALSNAVTFSIMEISPPLGGGDFAVILEVDAIHFDWILRKGHIWPIWLWGKICSLFSIRMPCGISWQTRR
jgi:hypothetical protein